MVQECQGSKSVDTLHHELSLVQLLLLRRKHAHFFAFGFSFLLVLFCSFLMDGNDEDGRKGGLTALTARPAF